MANFRASIGHGKRIDVKRAQPMVPAGQNIGLTIGSSSTLYFDSGDASSGTAPWSFVGGSGTAPTYFTTGGADGNAAVGSNFFGWTMQNGVVANDYAMVWQLGGVPAAPSQLIRNGFAQFRISYAGTFGLPSGGLEKLAIVQFYRQTSPDFGNGFRKYQIIPGVLNTGLYVVSVVEMNDSGSFLRSSYVQQSGTTHGPSSAQGQWDTLRLEWQLDTNGSQVGTEYGVGFGNGIIRLWRNNTLIINATNVNIVRGETPVVGRFFATPSHEPYVWTGSTARVYYDQCQLANSASVLAAMPSSTIARVVGNDNPDSITNSTEMIISKDYTTEVGSDVVEDPNIVQMEWNAAYGYNSPGWRARPTPVNGTAEAEDIAGWSFPFGGVFGVDEYELIVVSFMLKMSAALLNEMSGPSGFMAHPLKFLDVKAYNAAGTGEGARNCFHFCDYGNGPQFAHSGGGGGSNSQTAFGPDWRNYADVWTWCAMVWDMRGATAAERYMAMYTKRAGDSGVTRIGRRFENQSIGTAPNMEPYNGRGFLGFFSPLAGYWDDIHDAANLVQNPANYALHIDRVRITNGWPTGSDGPPF